MLLGVEKGCGFGRRCMVEFEALLGAWVAFDGLYIFRVIGNMSSVLL
jgi:hypothetical protein